MSVSSSLVVASRVDSVHAGKFRLRILAEKLGCLRVGQHPLLSRTLRA